MMEAVSRQSKNAILSCLRSHSPMNRVNILHLFPFLTLGLAFLDTQLLEVDVRLAISQFSQSRELRTD
jgi:hypothetical protein